MSDTVLVSACLLGLPCRHDGEDRRDPGVLRALAGAEIVPVCPEVAGGLGIPRSPAWLDGARVVDREGRDVSAAFARGAAVAVEAAQRFGARRALLKQNSPSCGTSVVGTSRGRAPGRGIAASALAQAGLAVAGEDAPW